MSKTETKPTGESSASEPSEERDLDQGQEQGPEREHEQGNEQRQAVNPESSPASKTDPGDAGESEDAAVTGLQRAIAAIDRLIEARDAHLAIVETLFLRKLETKSLSLLNPSGIRNYSYRKIEMPSLQLECKIRRRGVFLLRQRREFLCERLRIARARVAPRSAADTATRNEPEPTPSAIEDGTLTAA